MKIFVVIVLHIALSSILALPYFNLVNIVFGFSSFLIDWIVILILFKPKKENILKIGLLMFIVGYPLALLGIDLPLELIGNIGYLMLATYILFSLKEIRSK